MKRIGLFYGKNSVKTASVANKIKDAFTDVKVDLVAIDDAWQKDFESFDYLIAGVSTWFDGELPSYWDEIKPLLTTIDLKDKKVALFGLGDQVNYPDNFVDGIGILAKVFEASGARIVGSTSKDGYLFTHSLALEDDKFVGLALDIENQPEKTDERIRNWVGQLKLEFLE